jgi:hypothetical protein
MSNSAGVGSYIESQQKLATTGIDLFTLPEIEASLITGTSITVYPQNAINDTGPYDFLIPSDDNDYTFLPLTRLYGELEVVKADGTAVTAAEKNGIVNLFPHSIFKQIECSINGTQIVDLSTPTYPYKAFIETHLSFNQHAKEGHLYCECYTKETVGKENNFEIGTAAEPNPTFDIRKKRCESKIYFSMILHIDLFQSERYLLPGCEIKLKFIRNDDKFSLLGNTQVTKIKVNELFLSIRRVTLDPVEDAKINSDLEKGPAAYPIDQSRIKTFTIPSGLRNHNISQIFRGQLPRSLIIGFVDTAAYDGAINKNPFVFEHNKLNYFNLFVNGAPVLPTVLQPDFTTKKAIREYRWFIDNIDILHSNESNGISFEDYCSNSCFFAFDFTPDLCNSFHDHGAKAGVIDLHVGFAEQLPKNITCVVYGSFKEVITINKNKQVTLTMNGLV